MTTQQFDSSKYKEGQRQEWDSVAAAWKKWWPFFERNVQEVSTQLCQLAGIKQGDRVLVWPVADEVRQLELFMERVAPSV